MSEGQYGFSWCADKTSGEYGGRSAVLRDSSRGTGRDCSMTFAGWRLVCRKACEAIIPGTAHQNVSWTIVFKERALVTEDEWSGFLQRGFLRLEGSVTTRELHALQYEMDKLMMGDDDQAMYDQLRMELDGSSGLSTGFKGRSLDYRRIEGLDGIPIVRSYVAKPLFREICSRIYGPGSSIALFRAMLVNKPPGGGASIGWHQDYWSYLSRQPSLTTWLALDEATVENGALQIIPGSHKLGHLNPANKSGFLTKSMVDRYCRDQEAMYLQLSAGDAVILHNGLIHSSDANSTTRRRRALSVCYMETSTKRLVDGCTYPVISWDDPIRA